MTVFKMVLSAWREAFAAIWDALHLSFAAVFGRRKQGFIWLGHSVWTVTQRSKIDVRDQWYRRIARRPSHGLY